MFDAKLRPLIDPPLNRLGYRLAKSGVSPNDVTLVGLGFGLAMAAVVALSGPMLVAIVFLALSRLADGLDGAVARASRKTDFGGYLDIFCDFVFYAAIPCAFALRDPSNNALVAGFLIASFYVNAASFLGFAIMAEKNGLSTDAQGQKSLYYAAGLLEGAETIAFFLFVCVFPSSFAICASAFAILCLFTAVARVFWARKLIGQNPRET
ncbi:CDP-alcohol phosphatidyltransferase family protein [Thioclava sp. FR2]|uniref:CDP-alcohol phosphatidyltransferase family protein n=1 Tax=Thioclava sp. FR2 TaxID=3445780 RepID=UPI003EC00BA5